jgi:hypothetical protein
MLSQVGWAKGSIVKPTFTCEGFGLRKTCNPTCATRSLKGKRMPLILLIILMIIAEIMVHIKSAVIIFAIPIEITLLIGGSALFFYQIYIYLYFKGEKFKTIKYSIKNYTDNCNKYSQI